MSQDTQELARLRAAFAARPAGSPRAGDLPGARGDLGRGPGRAAPAELREVMEHTAVCASCAEDWRLAAEFERQSAAAQTATLPAGRVIQAGSGSGGRWTAAAALAAGLLIAVGIYPPGGFGPGAHLPRGRGTEVRSLLARGAGPPPPGRRAALVARPGRASTTCGRAPRTCAWSTRPRARRPRNTGPRRAPSRSCPPAPSSSGRWKPSSPTAPARAHRPSPTRSGKSSAPLFRPSLRFRAGERDALLMTQMNQRLTWEPAETFSGLKRYRAKVRGSRQPVRSYHQRGGQGEPAREQKTFDCEGDTLMADEQTPVVETQSAQDYATLGTGGQTYLVEGTVQLRACACSGQGSNARRCRRTTPASRSRSW